MHHPIRIQSKVRTHLHPCHPDRIIQERIRFVPTESMPLKSLLYHFPLVHTTTTESTSITPKGIAKTLPMITSRHHRLRTPGSWYWTTETPHHTCYDPRCMRFPWIVVFCDKPGMWHWGVFRFPWAFPAKTFAIHYHPTVWKCLSLVDWVTCHSNDRVHRSRRHAVLNVMPT